MTGKTDKADWLRAQREANFADGQARTKASLDALKEKVAEVKARPPKPKKSKAKKK